MEGVVNPLIRLWSGNTVSLAKNWDTAGTTLPQSRQDK